MWIIVELFCLVCFDSLLFSHLLSVYDGNHWPGAFQNINVFPRELINKKCINECVRECWLHTSGHEVCFNCVDVVLLLFQKENLIEYQRQYEPSDPLNTSIQSTKTLICVRKYTASTLTQRWTPGKREAFRRLLYRFPWPAVLLVPECLLFKPTPVCVLHYRRLWALNWAISKTVG